MVGQRNAAVMAYKLAAVGFSELPGVGFRNAAVRAYWPAWTGHRAAAVRAYMLVVVGHRAAAVSACRPAVVAIDLLLCGFIGLLCWAIGLILSRLVRLL
jgi:hypothetical protein